jgi:hypothetical protein
MFKVIAPLMFTVFAPLFANAQLITPTEQPVIIKKTPEVIEEDSSEHNRMEKTYEIGLMPWGVGPIPAGNSGISIATYLTRNSAIVFGYNQLIAGRECWGSLSCSDKGYSFEVHYRKFFGNSFYVAGGVEQRHVTIEGGDSWGSEDYSFDGDSTALGVVVGNQWHWQSFFLGCDWVGITVPVSWNLSNVKTSTYTYDFDSAKKTYVTGTTGMLLRLHLGMAF